MIKRILLPLNLGNVFTLISLDTSDIKVEKGLNIDKLKNFNVDI